MTDKQKNFEERMFEALCDCVGPDPDDTYDRMMEVAKQADKALSDANAQIAELENEVIDLKASIRTIRNTSNSIFDQHIKRS